MSGDMKHQIYLIDIVRCIASEQEAEEGASKLPLQLHTTQRVPFDCTSYIWVHIMGKG